MSKLRLAGLIRESIVDGPGLRFVLFTQGCPHHCPGCHNPDTHPFEGGTDCDLDKLAAEILKNPLLQGITYSGGEPFCQAAALWELSNKLKGKSFHLMAYTGYTFEQLLDEQDPDRMKLLSALDLLVDGPFLLEQRDLTLCFRGSSNQRVLNVPESLKTGKAVLAEGF